MGGVSKIVGQVSAAQLDFFFLNDAAPSSAVRLAALRTQLVDTPSFYVPGAPLSDHFGLATDFAVRC